MPFLPESIWRRRLASEKAELDASGESFSANSDLTQYDFTVRGAGFFLNSDGSVGKAGSHRVRVSLKREYPYAGGMDVVWLTPIFHPNIRSEDGKVCIHLLNAWAEGQTVASLVAGLRQLLANPNPQDPLNKEAAKFFIEHPDALSASALPPSQNKLTRPKIVFSS
ncbi:hypothetical protein HY095_03905 [Candidatus Micrarchaeota archaeon]|nr:hypothetical protein [Candidatus Micrarchaeota archaeon]